MKSALLLFPLFAFFSSAAQKDTLTHTVLFQIDKHALRVEGQQSLENWLAKFSEYAVDKLEVIGYTDHLGTDSYNRELSKKRAEIVLQWIRKNKLIDYGISEISSKGESFSIPTTANKNGVPKDRKVEVLIFLNTSETEESGLEKLVVANVGESIVLKNLNFIGGRHFLLPQAEPDLERLKKIMLDNPDLKVEIQGHICCKFDSVDGLDADTRTYELSLNRAKYIRSQLVLANVPESRMQCKGFGSTRPLIYPEKSAADQTRNRRVEIKILAK
ncbi:MAG: OmpA family protein [Flavobacteriales bacterium]|nr:OmpA family protein [Flavobacteriales bacterium]